MPAPAAPTPYSPADQSIGIVAGDFFNWSGGAGATGFDVYLDTVNPPVTMISSNQAPMFLAVPALAAATRYYWKVVARNGSGTTDSAILTFVSFDASRDYAPDVWIEIYDGANWIVLPDVVREAGIYARLGVTTVDPNVNTASPGIMQWAQDNSASNSVQTLGYYAMSNASRWSLFEVGTPVRLVARTQGNEFFGPVVQWTGKLRGADPVTGLNRSRWSFCTAYDLIYDLDNTEMSSLDPASGVTEVQALQQILASLPSEMLPVTAQYSLALDTFSYAFHNARKGVKALSLIKDVVDSSRGWFFVDGDNILHYYNRQADVGVLTSQAFDDGTLCELEVPTLNSLNWNRILGTIHRKTVDDSAFTNVLNITAKVMVPAGETLSFFVPYSDPANKLKFVGVNTPQAMVATTDYMANTAEDGSGTNVTGSVTASAYPFAATAFVTIVNSSGSDVWMVDTSGVSKLNMRGYAVIDNDPETYEDFESKTYGVRTLELDYKYQDNQPTAREFGAAVLDQFSEPGRQVKAFEFDASLSQANSVAAVIGVKLGYVVTVSEIVSGIDQIDLVCRGIEYTLTGRRLRVRVTPYPRSANAVDAFILDSPTHGLLDDASSLLGYS